MARLALVPLDRPGVAPLAITRQLRNQLVYFMSPRDTAGLPPLGEKDYWFAAAEVAQWADDGVIHIVSPLDTAGMTEVELSEEQETLVAWLHKHEVQHVRLDGD